MESEYYSYIWLIATLGFIFIEAFFSMMEMALVSFNKVRLQYYLNKNNRRAKWIHALLKNPSRLFGTVLLGVNIALVVGSECSRQLYEAWNLDPDLAPLTQVLLVVILAELAPLFAARRYAEQVALLGIPIIYAISIVMSPLVGFFGLFANAINRLLDGKGHTFSLYLNREELQKVLEEQDEGLHASEEKQDFNLVVANIFTLRNKIARQIMVPLKNVKMVPAQFTVNEFSDFLRQTRFSHLPIYHRFRSHIVGMISARDLTRSPPTKKIRDYCRPPWFITETVTILQILKQFRYNHQDVAVVLNVKGEAIGIITLDDILDEIFGEIRRASLNEPLKIPAVIDRTFPADMTIQEFNQTFNTQIDPQDATTLGEMMVKYVGAHPQVGDNCRIDRYELIVKETNLLGHIKTIDVHTIN